MPRRSSNSRERRKTSQQEEGGIKRGVQAHSWRSLELEEDRVLVRVLLIGERSVVDGLHHGRVAKLNLKEGVVESQRGRAAQSEEAKG